MTKRKSAAEYLTEPIWGYNGVLISKDELKASDLAKIAAPLAVGKSRSQYLEVAQEAFELWKACEVKLKQMESEAHQPGEKEYKRVFGHRKKEEDYYTLTELLKQVFPKARTVSERLSRFRVFLDYYLRQLRADDTKVPIDEVPKTSLDERNNFLEKLREDGLMGGDYFTLFQEVERFNDLKRQERAVKAGKESGKKRKK